MTKEQNMNEGCPSEWTLSRFVENRLEEGAAGDILAHVAGCERCRSKISGLGWWLNQVRVDKPTEVELSTARKAWLRMQWRRVAEYFRPKTEFLAAADGQTPNDIGTVNALRSGFIHFLSRTPRGLKDGWHVKLSIPARPTEKTLLRMSVMDGTDEPIQNGTLYFCRLPLKVVAGKASLSLADFQRKMDEAIISLRRDDGTDIPGDPVLGYDLLK